jgi:hypothetical protein
MNDLHALSASPNEPSSAPSVTASSRQPRNKSSSSSSAAAAAADHSRARLNLNGSQLDQGIAQSHSRNTKQRHDLFCSRPNKLAAPHRSNLSQSQVNKGDTGPQHSRSNQADRPAPNTKSNKKHRESFDLCATESNDSSSRSSARRRRPRNHNRSKHKPNHSSQVSQSSLPQTSASEFKSNRCETAADKMSQTESDIPEVAEVPARTDEVQKVDSVEPDSSTSANESGDRSVTVSNESKESIKLEVNQSNGLPEAAQPKSSPTKSESYRDETIQSTNGSSKVTFFATSSSSPMSTRTSPSDATSRSLESMMLTENNRPVVRNRMFYLLYAINVFAWCLSVVYGLFFKSKRKQLPPIDEPLLFLSASELTARIKNRSLKCEQVIRAYIDRIGQVQKQLNAVVDSRFDDAIQEAKHIDQQLKNPVTAKSLLSKPLLGVPFSCKNSIAIRGMEFSAGSWYRRNVKAEEDAPVVANLRAAGAIPLVITNVSHLDECVRVVTSKSMILNVNFSFRIVIRRRSL